MASRDLRGGLTDRQRAIYRAWIAHPNKTDRQIAAALAMNPPAVSRILTRIFGRLGIDRRTANALRGGRPAIVKPMALDSLEWVAC